jgi:hypothetical protein
MTNLLELADRVEAGEAGVDLDSQIWCAIIGRTHGEDPVDDPAYTTSIDEALTLVPEGCAVDLTIWFGKNRARVLPCHKDDPGDRWLHRGSSPHFTADASTPARALTAACLRARAEMGK